MDGWECLLCCVLTLAVTVFLQGCENDGSAAGSGAGICHVSTVLASPDPDVSLNVTLMWRGELKYTAGNKSCEACCAAIHNLTKTHPDYTSLCEAAANISAGAVHTACGGCPDIILPPPEAEALCEPCAAGKWSIAGRGQCHYCAPGRWSGSGSRVCTPCAAGRASLTVAATSPNICTACPAGRWSPDGSTECSECAPGRWSTGGVGVCPPCAAGTWSATLAATSGGVCISCAEGKWSSKLGASDSSTCVDCPAGRWNAVSGAGNLSACSRCVAGRWSNETGATSEAICTSCGVGTWSSTVGATSSFACTACEAGTWSGTVGAAHTGACTFCAAGRYSAALGATSIETCWECPGGTFGAEDGTSECTACGAGAFSINASTSCTDCSEGYFQEALRATLCEACPGGRFNSNRGATTAQACTACRKGTYSTGAASACLACQAGKNAPSEGLVECLRCHADSNTPDGAHSCCPHDSEDWPVTSSRTLSIPPGKHWTETYLMQDGDCDPGGEDSALKLKTGSGAGDPILFTRGVYVSTLKKGKVHSCLGFQCHGAMCGVIPPDRDRLMPGVLLKVAAFIDRDGLSTRHKCADVVEVGFAGFGCEPNTIIVFLLVLVAVISLTIILGIIFEQLLRRRVHWFVETTLKVLPPSNSDAGFNALPTTYDLRYDVQAALPADKPGIDGARRFKAPGVAGIHAWTAEVQDVKDASAVPTVGSVQVDLKLSVPRPKLRDLQKWLQGRSWTAGKAWGDPNVTVEQQPPACIKEAAKLPGADLMEAIEMAAVRMLSCFRQRHRPNEELRKLHLDTAREVLAQFMQRRTLIIILAQTVANWTMVMVVPSIGLYQMTCAEGYPYGLHGVWGLYLLTSSLVSLWLLLRQLIRTPTATREFLSLFRIRIFLRFAAMLISVTDLYQDATFPVIAGRCGFDLWWVSLWLVFLGVGVMQVLVQVILLYSIRRRYLMARSPEERERNFIGGIFLALRGCDNHVLVYLIKPAVEERLGGGSSWSMKTMEARVAFLRFVFEDAEQSALQMSFLLFFDQATLADKVWVGLSTGTSLMLSFTLTVQTLAEVRDWLWFQLLAWFPGGARWPEARILWLLFLILIYRAVSIFPWLGSCTPAGDHNASTLRRLLVFSPGKVPTKVVQETLLGSGIAFGVGCIIIAISCLIWARPLRLPRNMFVRLCCRGTRRNGRPDVESDGALYDFDRRLEVGDALGLKKEQDEDSWLDSLRRLHAAAKSASCNEALDLLADLDGIVFRLVHANQKPDDAVLNSSMVEEILVQLENMLLSKGPSTPKGASDVASHCPVEDLLKVLRSTINDSAGVAAVRGRVLRLLGDRCFRKAGIVQKAQLIDEVTDKQAPLKLIHWSVIEQLGHLPAFGSSPGAEDVPTILGRVHGKEGSILTVYLSHTWTRQNHPDTEDHEKAKTLVQFASWLTNWAASQQMNCEVFFWVDYSCMKASLGLDMGLAALPLYIASCSQVLMWRTPDFERCSWTMVERLLAYSFCPGGLTPFAVSASSFRPEMPVEVKASDEVMVEDIDTPTADEAIKPKPAGSTRVVPIIATAGDYCPAVHRRARKLPDPLDTSVCRPSGLAAANVQRRRVEQLVWTALAIPALETFADRQPVDFGLTEVIEQFLGASRPLPLGEPVDGGDAGAWLETKAAAQAVRDWHLTVQNVKAVEGTDDKGGKELKAWQARPVDEEGHIILMDRVADDSKVPALPPKPEEISKLFDNLDAAYEAQVAGTAGDNLEEAAVKLAEALRADLLVAEASGDEKNLREALLRIRDVDLPMKDRLTKKLCQLQLTNAMEAKDIMSIRMAMRYAKQHELTDLQEYADAQAARVQLQKEQLQARALAVVRQDTPDINAIVSVVEVARRRGWNEIADEALRALKAAIEKPKDPAGIGRLARVHRTATEQKIHAVVAMTSEALRNLYDFADETKDAAILCNLVKAGHAEGCGDIVQSAREALLKLIEHWQGLWKEAHRDEAEGALQQILTAALDCKLEGVVQSCSDAIENAKRFEAGKQVEARNLLQPSSTPKDFVAAFKVAGQWHWDDITVEVVEAFKSKIDAAAAEDASKAVIELAEIHDAASEVGLAAVTDISDPAVHNAIDMQRRAAAGVALLDTARVLESRGFGEFAGHARQALRQLIEGWKESDDLAAGVKVSELHDAAEACGDDVALGLADDAIDAAKGREDAKRSKLRDALNSAADAGVIVDLVSLARVNAWADIADEGTALLHTRIADGIAAGDVAGFTDVTKARHAAKKRRDHAIVEVTGTALNTRIEEAMNARDSVPLLEIARAADAEDCSEISGSARRSLATLITSWREGQLTSVPPSSQALVDFAQSCGEDDIASSVRQIVNLAKRVQSAKDSTDAVMLAELARDASQASCSRLYRDVLKTLQDTVAAMKAARDVDSLCTARDAAKRCSMEDVAKSAGDAVDVANRLATAKAGKDLASVVSATSSAAALGCDAFATDGREYLIAAVRELQKEVKIPGKRQILRELHGAAKGAGLDDVADVAVDAVGGSLPKDWSVAHGDKKGSWLEKVPAKDKELIDRIQALVDATFQGWGRLGHDCVTRDRHKSGNPLASRLKVEEVIHVENTENYLNFTMRREEVAREFHAMPPGDRPTDWNIKTQQVSLKGVWRHPEDPVDASLNEAWLWHGTSEAGVTGITDTDFDMARAGTAVGSMFGRGLYFAESCLKSDEYTKADARGFCPLLLCRVTLGRILHCDHAHPWEVADTLENAVKSGEYHAVLGDREKPRGTYREYIVFDNDQVYPEYIVWYSRQAPFKPY